jgi:hypothetical protein
METGIKKTVTTKAQAERNRRDAKIVAAFDAMDGAVSAVVGKIALQVKLSNGQVRNILKDAGRIGRVH